MKIKKIFLLSLIGASAISLVGCNKTPEKPDDNTNENPNDSVEKGPLKSIYTNVSAAKTTFYINEDFTTDGLKIMGDFTTTREEVDNSKIQIDSSEFNNKKAGTYRINIKYVDNNLVKTTYYNVNVVSILDSIDHLVGIECSGAKNVFKANENFTTDGLEVKAVYYNPSTKETRKEDITNDSNLVIDSSNFNSKTIGLFEIVLSYSKNYTDTSGHSQIVEAKTFYSTEVESKLTRIATQFNAKYDAYTIGDDGTFNTPDTSNWKVYAYYEGISSRVLLDSSDYSYEIVGSFTTNPENPNYKSSYTINFTYKYKDDTQTCSTTLVNNPYNAPIVSLNPDLIETTEYSENVIVDSVFTLKAIVGGTIVVDKDVQQYPTSAIQYSFTNRVKLQSNGAMDARSIQMNIKAGQTIVAYVMSDTASEDVLAGFYNADGVELKTVSVDGNKVNKIEYKVTSDGIYYLWGTNGSLNVYRIDVTA